MGTPSHGDSSICEDTHTFAASTCFQFLACYCGGMARFSCPQRVPFEHPSASADKLCPASNSSSRTPDPGDDPPGSDTESSVPPLTDTDKSSSSSSDSDDDTPMKTRPGRVNVKRRAQRAKRKAAMKASTQRVQGPDKQPRGRPGTSKTARATKRLHVVDQGKLATLAARAMANGTPSTDAVLAAALDTPGGRKQFPNLAHKQEQNA